MEVVRRQVEVGRHSVEARRRPLASRRRRLTAWGCRLAKVVRSLTDRGCRVSASRESRLDVRILQVRALMG